LEVARAELAEVSATLKALQAEVNVLRDSVPDMEDRLKDAERLERQTKAIDVSSVLKGLGSLRVVTNASQSVVDAQGLERTGIALHYGPVAVFVSADQQLSGTFDPFMGQPVHLAALLDASAPSLLPMVVSTERTGFVAWFRRGGPVMIPLFCVGLLSIGIIFFKLWDIRMLRRKIARLTEGNVAAPFDVLLKVLREHKNSPVELREEKAHEAILGIIPRFERGLGGLSVLGASAPLLGLLGTVTGMINTFQAVTRMGATDIRLLAGGISEALITTEVGLAIAIPVLLIHAWLARRVQARISELEAFAEAQ